MTRSAYTTVSLARKYYALHTMRAVGKGRATSMRITDVRAIPVRATRHYPTLIGAARLDPRAHRLHDRSDFILIQIVTDAGHVGLGEVSDLPEGMRLPDGSDATAPRVEAVL